MAAARPGRPSRWSTSSRIGAVAGRARRELRPEVAAGLARRADVAQDQPEQASSIAPSRMIRDRRDDQALLDVLVVDADAARRPAADVEVVGHRRGVRDDPAVAEDRAATVATSLRWMPAEMAVVADDPVAGAEPVGAVGARGSRGTKWASVPRWAGWPNDWAMIRPAGSTTAHEWSRRVLMLVE